MNQNASMAAAFVLGAAAGAVATWYTVKDYYKRLADEEVESVKAVFTVRKQDTEKENESSDIHLEEDPQPTRAATIVNQYHALVMPYNPGDYGPEKENGVDELEEKANDIRIIPMGKFEDSEKPYLIEGNDISADENYPAIELTLYEDGVLTDDQDEPIEDIEGTIGDLLKHFGEDGNMCMYVRNDKRQCDYEIVYNPQTYAESHS